LWRSADPFGWKHELPAPVGRRVRELAIQRKRQDTRPNPRARSAS
jgi:hypothetical protein